MGPQTWFSQGVPTHDITQGSLDTWVISHRDSHTHGFSSYRGPHTWFSHRLPTHMGHHTGVPKHGFYMGEFPFMILRLVSPHMILTWGSPLMIFTQGLPYMWFSHWGPHTGAFPKEPLYKGPCTKVPTGVLTQSS